LLGGITVIYQLPSLVSTAHLGLSLIFLSVVLFNYRLVSEQKLTSELLSIKLDNEFTGIRHFIFLLCFLIYMQILLGAFIRHTGAGVACGLGSQSAILCFDSKTWLTTFWPSDSSAKIHFLHRIFGVLLALVSIYFVFNFKNKIHFFKKSLLFFLFSILSQVALGVATVFFSLAVIPTTLHLLFAVLSLISLLNIFLRMREIEFSRLGLYRDSVISDIVDLFKPKLSGLVIFTSLTGVLLAPESFGFFQALFSLLGLSMVVISAATLNCYFEREVDGKMERTRNRSLPAGRLNPAIAFYLGSIIGPMGLLLMGVFSNAVATILALFAFILYVWAYTPLKQKSPVALYVGAIPGALPPLIGWTMVTGRLDLGGILLFVLIFIWQLPHFLAISLNHEKDYEAAGILVYPSIFGVKTTVWLILATTLILVGLALVPYWVGWPNNHFLLASGVLGLALLGLSFDGVRLAQSNCSQLSIKSWAKSYFWASIIYLPLLFAALTIFR